MKNKLLILLLFIFFGIASATAQEKRHALVIGNADYRDAELLNPAHDAELISKTLKQLGFNVRLLIDANQQQMEDAIDDFGRDLHNGGVGLFFYAGHGIQSKGVNYLIPLHADLQREKDLRYKAVDAGQVLDEMANANNGLNIIILDACRNNPMSRSFRSSAKGLARMSNAPKGSLLAYSTAPGEEASDGDGYNSPYTTELVKAMKQTNKPLEMAFKEVTRGVQKKTKGKQVPWMSSSVTGNFYFSPAEKQVDEQIAKQGKQEKTKKQGSVQHSADYEYRFWNEIKESPSAEMYQAYLQQYPKGHFALIAQIRLDKLKQQSEVKKRNSTVTEKSKNKAQANITEQVNKKLNECEQHFQENRLTTGKSGNALQCYRKILTEDKNNKQALQGIKKILEKYEKWYKKALNSKNKKKTVQFYTALKKLDPENASLKALQSRHNKLINADKPIVSKQKVSTAKVKEKLQKLDDNFVLVKAGCFNMGNPANKSGRDAYHEVCISKDYYISKYEVTQGQWEKVMKSRPSYFRICGKNCPVEKVSWSDVQQFIARLNKRTPDMTFRLPTEAEWEYACRERGKKQKYCGGNSLSELAWYNKNSDFKTHPVGSKRANQLGLYDMSGNVYEWTQDRLGSYPKQKTTDPRGVNKGNSRVLRGGSWRDSSALSASTARRGNRPDGNSKTIGFRLVMTRD